MSELPIFELPLVLLPGERIPLHIFEERYKRMVGRSISEGEPFGIVFHDENGARSIGCTARIGEVEELDDGRLNIEVAGGQAFRVLDRHEADEWPAAEVELVAEPDPRGTDDDVAAGARSAFADLAEIATGNRPDPESLSDADSYAIAARVELPPETKQLLLETRDENERMRTLAEALEALEQAVERAEIVADRARSNGRVSFGG